MKADFDIYDIPPISPRSEGPPRLPSAEQRKYYHDLAGRVVKKIKPEDPEAWLRGFCKRAIGRERPATAQDHNRAITALEHKIGRRDRQGIKTQPKLLKKMWTLARSGPGETILRDIVGEVTGHKTDSTRHLKRGEALEVIKRLQRN